jgi:cell wall-associated NlpC family hydrolase
MNADIVTEARTWIGTRWQHQGPLARGRRLRRPRHRSRQGRGGIELRHPRLPAHRDGRADGRDLFETSDARTCRAAIEPGDVLVFAFDRQRHMAIAADYVFGGLSIIHAYSLAPRKVIETRLDEKWLSRLRAAFRVPQVAA